MAKVRLELDFTLESPYWWNQSLQQGPSAALINCMVEKYPNADGSVRSVVRKRPGLTSRLPGVGSGAVKGMFVDSGGSFWRVVGSALYWNDTVVVPALNGTGAGFVEISPNPGGGQSRIFFCDGTDGYILIANSAQRILSVNFPRPHIPMPVYMDGYVFLQSRTTGRIYNSGLNAVESWDALSFIEAAAFPDNPCALTRVKNSIVALGEGSIEFFYNAGNAKGSPLSPMQAQQIAMGAVSRETVQLLNDKIYFMGRNKLGGAVIMELDGFSLRPVSPPGVNNFLNSTSSASFAGVDSVAFNIAGHPLYIINVVAANLSIVYDASTNVWSVWTGVNGAGLFVGKYASSYELARHIVYVCDRGTAAVWEVDADSFADNSVNPIYSSVTTLRFDGGTMKRKFQRGLEILFSPVPATFTSGTNLSEVTLYTRDDDGTGAADAKGTFNMVNKLRAYVKTLGSFRRRRYVLSHNSIAPFLLEGIELEYDEGTN